MGHGSVLSLVSSADFQFHAQNEWSEMYWFRRASKRSPRQGYGCVSKRSPQWLRRGPVKEVQRGYDNPVKEFPVVTAARVELVQFSFCSIKCEVFEMCVAVSVVGSDKSIFLNKNASFFFFLNNTGEEFSDIYGEYAIPHSPRQQLSELQFFYSIFQPTISQSFQYPRNRV